MCTYVRKDIYQKKKKKKKNGKTRHKCDSKDDMCLSIQYMSHSFKNVMQ